MQQLSAQIDEAAAFIRTRWRETPRVGIVLGSGLGSAADAIQHDAVIDYSDVPHFLQSTALGHRGRLLCCHVKNVPVVAMQGRLHCYEGYTAAQVTFPIRVIRQLGIELLIVSNAAGGLNPNFGVGDVMVIDDHINLLNRNPLIGMNDERLGPRFPDMSAPYDRALGDRAMEIARENNFACHRGTYIGMLGPNYETRAEIRMLRRWGDAVGMSTVPEAIVAVHAGLRVLGLSTVTNLCSPDVVQSAHGEEVVAAGHAAKEKVLAIVRGIVADFARARN